MKYKCPPHSRRVLINFQLLLPGNVCLVWSSIHKSSLQKQTNTPANIWAVLSGHAHIICTPTHSNDVDSGSSGVQNHGPHKGIQFVQCSIVRTPWVVTTLSSWNWRGEGETDSVPGLCKLFRWGSREGKKATSIQLFLLDNDPAHVVWATQCLWIFTAMWLAGLPHGITALPPCRGLHSPTANSVEIYTGN